LATLRLFRANAMRMVPATPTGTAHAQNDDNLAQTKQ